MSVIIGEGTQEGKDFGETLLLDPGDRQEVGGAAERASSAPAFIDDRLGHGAGYARQGVHLGGVGAVDIHPQTEQELLLHREGSSRRLSIDGPCFPSISLPAPHLEPFEGAFRTGGAPHGGGKRVAPDKGRPGEAREIGGGQDNGAEEKGQQQVGTEPPPGGLWKTLRGERFRAARRPVRS
jgi:hypothetical protein